MAIAVKNAESPPDVRGPTAPLPACILGAGALAMGLASIGTLVIQISYALASPPLSQECKAAGLTNSGKNPITGARGVCHIIDALRSPPETTVLLVAIALGAAAIGAGYSMYRGMDTKRKREHALTGGILGIQAVVAGTLLLLFRSGHSLPIFALNFLNFVYLRGEVGAFVNGAKNTLVLALGGELGGIVLGLILSLFALSSRRAVRAPARAYVNFFRGTPLLWQLIFLYFGLALGLGLNLGTYTAALVAFILNTGAYAAEVFRAGIQSVERGQLEAARGLGMSYVQSMRYAIVPQAVRRVIPPLMNEFVILIKDTSLVAFLGVTAGQYELLKTGYSGYLNTFNASFLVATAIGYLIVTLPLIGLVNAAERRLRSGLVGIGGASSL